MTYSYGILFPVLLDEFQQGKANTGESNKLEFYSFSILVERRRVWAVEDGLGEGDENRLF